MAPKQATCKTCEQLTFNVTFSTDNECKKPLPFASGQPCGHTFNTHKGPKQHEDSDSCFGKNSNLLRGLNTFLNKSKQAVIRWEQQTSQRGSGEVRPHQGLKKLLLTDSSET